MTGQSGSAGSIAQHSSSSLVLSFSTPVKMSTCVLFGMSIPTRAQSAASRKACLLYSLAEQESNATTKIALEQSYFSIVD